MSKHCCECCCGCKAKKIVPRMVKFDQGGTYHWTVPESTWYEVTVTGAGGAGGSAMLTGAPATGWISVVGGSGGAGGTAQKNIYLPKDEVVPIVVGRGGRNSKQMPPQGVVVTEPAGEASFFGTHCSATGGDGGETQPHARSIAKRPGNGGAGNNGDLNLFGGRSIAFCSYNQIQNQHLQFFSPGCSPSLYGGDGKMSFFSCNGQNGVLGAGGEGAIAQNCSTITQNKQDPSILHTPFYGGDGGDGVVVIRWLEFQ